MTDYTLSQLAQFNGKGGQPAYVAVDGKIYDITSSSIWGSGDHMSTHHAGNDLTTVFHGEHNISKLSGFPIIGNLITDTCAQISVTVSI